jgi:hypothetical protein
MEADAVAEACVAETDAVGDADAPTEADADAEACVAVADAVAGPVVPAVGEAEAEAPAVEVMAADADAAADAVGGAAEVDADGVADAAGDAVSEADADTEAVPEADADSDTDAVADAAGVVDWLGDTVALGVGVGKHSPYTDRHPSSMEQNSGSVPQKPWALQHLQVWRYRSTREWDRGGEPHGHQSRRRIRGTLHMHPARAHHHQGMRQVKCSG